MTLVHDRRSVLIHEQAKDWGNIMLALYERDGWTLVDDSHTEKNSVLSSQAYSSLPSSASTVSPLRITSLVIAGVAQLLFFEHLIALFRRRSH